MITLITMTQGNPVALLRTMESFKAVCNEFVIGDLCIFDGDREMIRRMTAEFHEQNPQTDVKLIKFPFNYIFKNGFSSILNFLAWNAAQNDFCIYMNVGEVIEVEVTPKLHLWTDADAQYFVHATDPHHWYRLYNRHKFKWDGLIHEELVPILSADTHIKAFRPSFQMKDTEKDMYNPFHAKVYNDVKELVYFNQYQRLIDEPAARGITNEYWLKEARDASPPMIDRLLKKGRRYEAFITGDLQLYLNEIHRDEEFKQSRDESDTLVNVQGNRKDVL